MNLGIQDAVDLAHTLSPALKGAVYADLDGYEKRRRPVVRATVAFTNVMTRASTLSNGPAQLARNAVFSAVGHLPPVRPSLALHGTAPRKRAHPHGYPPRFLPRFPFVSTRPLRGRRQHFPQHVEPARRPRTRAGVHLLEHTRGCEQVKSTCRRAVRPRTVGRELSPEGLAGYETLKSIYV